MSAIVYFGHRHCSRRQREEFTTKICLDKRKCCSSSSAHVSAKKSNMARLFGVFLVGSSADCTCARVTQYNHVNGQGRWKNNENSVAKGVKMPSTELICTLCALRVHYSQAWTSKILSESCRVPHFRWFHNEEESRVFFPLSLPRFLVAGIVYDSRRDERVQVSLFYLCMWIMNHARLEWEVFAYVSKSLRVTLYLPTLFLFMFELFQFAILLSPRSWNVKIHVFNLVLPLFPIDINIIGSI